MYATGLMDEDGRNTAWLGMNAVCLTPATACDGSDLPAPDASTAAGTDLDAWVAQFAAKYFKTQRGSLKAAAPNTLFFGPDSMGTWGVPPRKEILQAASQYLDGAFTSWFGNQPDQAKAIAQYSFLTRYLGDKPIMNFVALHAQPDSPFSNNPSSNCCFGLTSQPLRAQQWNTILSSMLNTPSYNNSYQWIGIVWWGLYDFENE